MGPLEDSAGNIISQYFLMAENLNGYISSVFTIEDIRLFRAVNCNSRNGS